MPVKGDYDYRALREAIDRAIRSFDEEIEYLVKEYLDLKAVMRCKYEQCNRIILTCRQWENLGSFRRDIPGVMRHGAKGYCNSCYTAIYRRGQPRLYVRGVKV